MISVLLLGVSTIIVILINWGLLALFSRIFEFSGKKYTSLVVSSIYGVTLFVLSLIALLVPALLDSIPYTIFVFLVSFFIFIYAVKNYYFTDFKWATFTCGIIFGLNLLIGFLFGSILALVAGIVRIPPY